ncbi:high mobility group-T protein-like isoform X1 [Siniperca chuatsi]|uniref:high mobility group-T protein-like isoform X1 n=1 Tax=Siniperca chuatsi TaxID=119488 RepID=UPI001CE0CEF1|nr:high mobility group-T protein-like isoform X1 [Siniperca chuatsi]
MGKDPTKPRGKMSSYAYFVQTCREEHKKKHPEASVNFAEFSKKCSERWKTMSAKEKGKFEDLARQDKARYEREMMSYVPVRGGKKKKFKDPNAPKRPPSAFFIFCSDFRPKVKGETPGLSIGDVAKRLGEMWNSTAAEDKQPYEKKAAKLKEKMSQHIVLRARRAAEHQEKPRPRQRRRMMTTMMTMKMTRRRKTMMMMMTSRWRATYIVVIFLFIKHFTPLYTLHLLKENTLVSKG